MADLKEAYRRFDPALPLDGDLLDQYYVGRPSDPVGKLAKGLDFSESAQHILLVGQRGVGKTTELLRLAKSLGSNNLPLVHSLDHESISKPALGISRLTEELVRQARARGWSINLDLLSQAAIRDARFEMSIAMANLAAVVDHLRKVALKPVLLVDGLEKKRGEKQKARFVTELGRLECSVVLVVPLSLVLLPDYSAEVGEWDRTVTLPAISLRNRDGSPDESGRSLLNSILDRRDKDLLFIEEAKSLVVNLSAGIHRTLLMLAQDACLNALTKGSSCVDLDSVEEAVDARHLEMIGFLTPRFLGILSSVRDTKLVNSFADALPLLERNSIVSYQNSTAWFDVHPLVRPALDAYKGKERVVKP